LKVAAIIPARYASTRFPGKPLADIKGKPMIRRVYEQAKLAPSVSEVIVATDDERIYNAVASFGGTAVYTDPGHQSGTDRCYEAYLNSGISADVVINVQGDEPFIHPEQIEELIRLFTRPEVIIGTLVKKITEDGELFNPNKVKCVRNAAGEALYFSRHPIPFQKSRTQDSWLDHHVYYKHIGMYGFRPSTLAGLVKLALSPLEVAESLEQLRWLENGYRIHTHITTMEALAVDTPEDLQQLLNTYTGLH
jgi:3-deoxy-manno-octulosonate cytidylyltransferase (CMP-KDO synthetase)